MFRRSDFDGADSRTVARKAPMNWLRPFTLVCVSLACLGMILPASVLEAAPLAGRASPRRPVLSDVELDAKGTLRAIVINAQGIPVAGTPIVVYQGSREVGRTSTDAMGWFSIRGLRGGTCQVTVGRHAVRLRTWAARTAPPKTKRAALIVVGDGVVRGQRPLGEFLCSDCVLVTALVAAMIAVPIAVYNSDGKPSSP